MRENTEGGEAGQWRSREAEKQRSREAEKQRSREAEKQRNRETEKQSSGRITVKQKTENRKEKTEKT